MSRPACPSCGGDPAPILTGRGAVYERHEPGGKLCKALAWRRVCEERGLVRVVGQLVNDLSPRVPPEYGPFVLTQAMVDEETQANGWAKAQKKPGVVTAAFFPRWAVVLSAALGAWWSKEKVAAFARCRRDPEWRDALLSAADLAADEQAERRAVAAMCNYNPAADPELELPPSQRRRT